MKKVRLILCSFLALFDDGADCTGDNESSYGTGMFKKSHIKISQVDKLCG